MASMAELGIVRDGGDFIIDAELVAARFGLPVETFRAELASGAIVTICETGSGEDEGRTRLSFRRGALLWRFVLDGDGMVFEDPVMAARRARPPSAV